MPRYYKVLSVDDRSCNGGSPDLVWSLPTQNEDGSWTPGEWMPEAKGELTLCANGYHLAREQDLLRWLNASIYEAEPSEEMVEGDDKVVCRSVRLLRKTPWNQQTAVLFACDCAERVLPLFEREYPDDQRPRQAIETARKWVHGKATLEEVQAAADAAYTAYAAAYAANAAAYAAYAANAAADAAAYAAANAAYAAHAAHAAAYVAEKEWQQKRLMEYVEGRVEAPHA